MHRSITTELDAPAGRVHDMLASLDRYPEWLDLVADADAADAAATDVGPAWWVTLRARVGPFARSKRLRMVRTVHDAPAHLRFERAEVDGREHSAWILDVRIAERGERACAITVELSYGGGLWSTPLEAVLGSKVDAALPRLRRLVSG